MKLKRITPQTLAKLFHDVYEKEAVNLGWKTQKKCRVKFKDLPNENKQLMILVADKIIRALQEHGKGYDDFARFYNIHQDNLLNLDELKGVKQ